MHCEYACLISPACCGNALYYPDKAEVKLCFTKLYDLTDVFMESNKHYLPMERFYNPLTMKIHREGYKILLSFFFFLTFINFMLYFIPVHQVTRLVVSSVSSLMFLFTVNFFRFPQRECSFDAGTVVSPADGKIVAIEEAHENEYFKEPRKLVSIFMSAWNVHINWLPISGRINYHRYNPGAFLVAFLPKSSTHNENTTVVIQNNKQQEVLLRQIAGAVARRIVTYPQAGDMVEQGSQLGFIKFGSRVDIYLPPDAQVHVEIGDKVTGNRTPLAEL